MELKRSPLFVGFFTLVFVAFFSVMNISAADEVTITGRIWAADWDNNDKVISVAIVTEEGKEYYVLDNANSKKLLKLIQKIVEAMGTIGQDDEGNKTIAVRAFEVIKEE